MLADDRLPVYSVRIQGHLPARLLEELAGLRVEPLSNGETLLLVPVADQSALYGLLDRLRDLNIHLIEIHPVSS